MRFRRALDRGNVTEALSAAAELQSSGLRRRSKLTRSSRMPRRRDEVRVRRNP
jgi:hypothetical protein